MVLNNAINANASTPLSVTQGGLGVSDPTIHGILVAQGSSAVSPKVLTDGQLLIGSTGADPVAANLTAAIGISILDGAGSITIKNIGGVPDLWTDVSSTSASMSVQNGYTANNVSLVSLALPTGTVAEGDWVEVNGKGTGGWKVTQAAGQQIFFGNIATTLGATGSLSSTLQYDCVKLRALANNANSWLVVSSVGNLSLA